MQIGFQRWDSILFVHWAMEAGALRPLLPDRVSVDEHDGRAYVSLTPFTLVGGRIGPLPPLPGLRTFHELNVRTYVRGPNGEPAIWFFSLEAANPLAAALARFALRLPYVHAHIRRSRDGDRHEYRSERPRSGSGFRATWRVAGDARPAVQGSLDQFLVERYALLARAVGTRLWWGPVEHRPWLLRGVEELAFEQDLDVADGLPPLGPPSISHYSDGADVRFLAPRLV
jgi:uncharacterized protein